MGIAEDKTAMDETMRYSSIQRTTKVESRTILPPPQKATSYSKVLSVISSLKKLGEIKDLGLVDGSRVLEAYKPVANFNGFARIQFMLRNGVYQCVLNLELTTEQTQDSNLTIFHTMHGITTILKDIPSFSASETVQVSEALDATYGPVKLPKGR